MSQNENSKNRIINSQLETIDDLRTRIKAYENQIYELGGVPFQPWKNPEARDGLENGRKAEKSAIGKSATNRKLKRMGLSVVEGGINHNEGPFARNIERGE